MNQLCLMQSLFLEVQSSICPQVCILRLGSEAAATAATAVILVAHSACAQDGVTRKIRCTLDVMMQAMKPLCYLGFYLLPDPEAAALSKDEPRRAGGDKR